MSGDARCVWRSETGADDGGLIVAVHGAMDRSGSFVRFARELADRYRVLRYDRRGYARSLGCDGPISMDRHVGDLLELIAGRPAVVLGHSYGGNVAVAASVRAPNIVGVVTYENPLPWMPWWTGSTRQPLPQLAPAMIAENFMRRVVGNRVWEELPETVKQQRRAEGDTLVAELAGIAVEPWNAADVAVPLVAMYGEHAEERHRRGAETMAAIGGRGPAIVVTGAGHNGPVTHPHAVAASVAELAESVGLRRAG